MKRAITLFGQSKLNPVIQATTLFIITSIVMVIASESNTGEDVEWLIAASSILLFATANPIIGIFKKKWLVYIVVSFVVFALLMIFDILVANALAERKIEEVTEYRLIFFAEVIFYILVTFLIGIFRTIVNMMKRL